jgi:hypothetical protein
MILVTVLTSMRRDEAYALIIGAIPISYLEIHGMDAGQIY